MRDKLATLVKSETECLRGRFPALIMLTCFYQCKLKAPIFTVFISYPIEHQVSAFASVLSTELRYEMKAS